MGRPSNNRHSSSFTKYQQRYYSLLRFSWIIWVLDALSNQGVTEVKILSKRNGMIKITNTFIITFGLPTPPKSVKASYLKLSVDQYVPHPLRCYNCQRFGHGKSNCKRKAICAKCSHEGHSDSECKNTPHCANCTCNQRAYSKECVESIKQEITCVKYEQNTSFDEAKKIVEQTMLSNTTNRLSPVQTVLVCLTLRPSLESCPLLQCKLIYLLLRIR